MGIPGGWELVLVAVLIMVLFGYKRLPDATRSLGRSMRIFKAESRGLHDDGDDGQQQEARSTTTAQPLPPVVPPASAPTTSPTDAQHLDADQPHLRKP